MMPASISKHHATGTPASTPDESAPDPFESAQPAPYSRLTPDRLLDALDSVGLRGDGRLLALNSFENRVYQVWLDDGASIVVKFYRPGRWRDAQIDEEHDFTIALADREIPVVPPMRLQGRTLHHFDDFAFAVHPRRGGRAPVLDDPAVLGWIGRFIGRIHALGANAPFVERPTLDPVSFGDEPRRYLLDSGLIPAELLPAWRAIVDQALDAVRRAFGIGSGPRTLRLHGDCHPGNILWTDEGPHFVDFDDARQGPAIQDLWMLLSGDAQTMGLQMGALLRGYRTFQNFDDRELALIEPLRTLRLLHYSAWIASRWEDPAFPAAFPWFGTARYWQDRILEMREQVAAMSEPAIQPV